MRKFVCNDCGGVSYSSAALENQRHLECNHCGHLACKEVPMTSEDLTPRAIKPKVASLSAVLRPLISL